MLSVDVMITAFGNKWMFRFHRLISLAYGMIGMIQV